ncbi:hypothetical protein Ciccas_011152, partial [Cichlidogyrus casuarinus]
MQGVSAKLKRSTAGVEVEILEISQKFLDCILSVYRGSGTHRMSERIRRCIRTIYEAAFYSPSLRVELFKQVTVFMLSNHCFTLHTILASLVGSLVNMNDSVVRECFDFLYGRFKRTLKELKKSGEIIYENEPDWQLNAQLQLFVALLRTTSSDQLVEEEFATKILAPLLDDFHWLLFEVALNRDNASSKLTAALTVVLGKSLIDNLLSPCPNHDYFDPYNMKTYHDKDWTILQTLDEIRQSREGYTGPMFIEGSERKHKLAMQLIERFIFPMLDLFEECLVCNFHKLDAVPHDKENAVKNYLQSVVHAVTSSAILCLAPNAVWDGQTVTEAMDAYCAERDNFVTYACYEDQQLFDSLCKAGSKSSFQPPSEQYLTIMQKYFSHSFIFLKRRSLRQLDRQISIWPYL